MAYISNKERGLLIKKTSNSYAFKKFLVILELLLLIGFVVVTFLSIYFTSIHTKNSDEDHVIHGWTWSFISPDSKIKFTAFGWVMLSVGMLTIFLGIISIFVVFSIKSPYVITKSIDKLDSSPVPGTKGKVSKSSSSQLKARRNKS